MDASFRWHDGEDEMASAHAPKPLLGSGPITGNGQDRLQKGTGKEERVGRAGCPHKRSDVAGALLQATAKRRGGEAAMASSLVGHDASCIAPSLAPSPDRLSAPSGPLPVLGTGPKEKAASAEARKGRGSGADDGLAHLKALAAGDDHHIAELRRFEQLPGEG